MHIQSSFFPAILSRIFIVCFLAIVNFSSFAQNSDPQLVKKCNDFEIDGSGSNSEWKKTEWQTLSKLALHPYDHETKCKFLYSSAGIYVLFSSVDQKITTKDYKDFEDIYEADVVEVFFHPKPELPQYFEYEINQMGRELILTLTRTGKTTIPWAPWPFEYTKRRSIKSKVVVNGGRQEIGAPIKSWTAEIFFPNEIFMLMSGIPPRSGDVWNANFCRIDYDAGMHEWSWSPGIKKSFHELEVFRSIKFE